MDQNQPQRQQQSMAPQNLSETKGEIGLFQKSSDKMRNVLKIIGLILIFLGLYNLSAALTNAFDASLAFGDAENYGSGVESFFANLGWVGVPFIAGLVLIMGKIKWKVVIFSSVIITIVIFVSSLFGTYNSLVFADEQIGEQLGNIKVMYQRRFDLVPDLVRVAREPLAQEQTIQGNLAKARESFTQANETNEVISSANQLEDTLRRFLMLSENYPTLRETKEYQNIQVVIVNTGDSLAQERIEYNNRAKSYNLYIKSFPTVLFAKNFGYKKIDYWSEIAGATTLLPENNSISQ